MEAGHAQLHLPGSGKQDMLSVNWKVLPNGYQGGVEVYFDSPYHDGDATRHLQERRLNFWPVDCKLEAG